MSKGNPRVYITSLAAYNSGNLHGEWCDATDADVIQETVDKVLKSCPCAGEEWAVHDMEELDGLGLGETPTVDQIAEAGQLVEKFGHALVKGVYEHCGVHLDGVEDFIDENSRGEYDSWADYAEKFTRDTDRVPEHLDQYIDWERMGSDWEDSGDFFGVEVDGRIHIFWSR